MKVIIYGGNLFGIQIAKHLIREKKDVTIIEPNEEVANLANGNLDCLIINESGTSLEVLEDAGIKNCDIFISITHSDESNMIACGLVSSKYEKVVTIACVRNIEYVKSNILPTNLFGIDFIVNPEMEVAERLYEILENGTLSNTITFENTPLLLQNVKVPVRSRFTDKIVKNIKSGIFSPFIIAAVNRGNQIIIPNGNTRILANDILTIVSEKGFVENFLNSIHVKNGVKKIIVVGGDKVAEYLIRDLLHKKDIKVTFLDSNKENCYEMSTKFPKILVINADISEGTIFSQDDFSQYDTIICLTENDEYNILTGLYTKKMGKLNSMVLINNTNYTTLGFELGIDSVVSHSESTVSSILRYIRKGNANSVHSLFEGRAEIYEFTLTDKSSVVGLSIGEIFMSSEAIVVGISRNSGNYIPNGDFILDSGDVVLILVERSGVEFIEKLFG